MQIIETILTKNACYISGKKHIPTGVMPHSTACPGVMAKTFLSSWNTEKPGGRNVCVHAFIDDTGIYLTLPLDMVGWHSGTGSLGSSKNANNNGYIGYEICEPKDLSDKEYFNKVKGFAIEFTAYICKKYNIQPIKPYVVTHCEGHQLGIASNHADIDHWWKKYHGYTMDMFRADVAAYLKATEESEEEDMKEIYYNTLEEVPEYAKYTIKKLIEKGALSGDGKGNYNLSLSMIRTFVVHDRLGIYDK